MLTYDVRSGCLADYTSEAYYRACFLEAFALGMAEKSDDDVFPGTDAWTGFLLVAQDFSAFMRAINERAHAEA
jgi:hypothetical protein